MHVFFVLGDLFSDKPNVLGQEAIPEEPGNEGNSV
jgi:hypothetical protein